MNATCADHVRRLNGQLESTQSTRSCVKSSSQMRTGGESAHGVKGAYKRKSEVIERPVVGQLRLSELLEMDTVAFLSLRDAYATMNKESMFHHLKKKVLTDLFRSHAPHIAFKKKETKSQLIERLDTLSVPIPSDEHSSKKARTDQSYVLPALSDEEVHEIQSAFNAKMRE